MRLRIPLYGIGIIRSPTNLRSPISMNSGLGLASGTELRTVLLMNGLYYAPYLPACPVFQISFER
jgi:hypothetical protein